MQLEEWSVISTYGIEHKYIQIKLFNSQGTLVLFWGH